MAHGYVAEWADLIGRQEEWYPHYNSQQLAAMGACKACSMRSMQHAACSIHAACGVQGSPRPGGHRVKSHKSRELMGWLTMSWVAGVSNSSKQFHEFHVHVKHKNCRAPRTLHGSGRAWKERAVKTFLESLEDFEDPLD
jgi:hypothetical protein